MTFNLQDRMPPFNICISNRFAEHVRRLHGALDKALVDIVSRWYSDEEASFPTRMPFEKHEEVLLKWIYGRGAEFVAPFAERYGMWRTDYLIEKTANGQEQAKICEINSRIPYNGFWVVGYHEEATKLLRGADDKLRSPNDFKVGRRRLFSERGADCSNSLHEELSLTALMQQSLYTTYAKSGQAVIHILSCERSSRRLACRV